MIIVDFVGMLAALLYRDVEYRLRLARSPWTAALEVEVGRGEIRLGRRIAVSLLAEGTVSGLFIFLFSGCVAAAAALLSGLDLGTPFAAMDFAYSLMPWLGLSGLFFRFRGQVYKKASEL